MKAVEVCLLLRHEDKANEISEQMITRVLESVAESVHECSCARRSAVAGGDEGKDSGGNTPAAPLSPSSTRHESPVRSSSSSSSPFSLCYHCTVKRYNELLSPVDFCREIVLSLAFNTQRQHELNHDVRTYRRQHVITSAFRQDIISICDRLIDFDVDTSQQAAPHTTAVGVDGDRRLPS